MSDENQNVAEWRQFEQMVARIEADGRPLGLLVKSPDHIRSLVTGELREVDASIRSFNGASEVLITVECRKRKSKEDVTWIEQLATKKQALGAVRTIAVSSAGFSKQAKKAAECYGIDLRLLSEFSVADINPSIRLDFVLFNHKRCSLAQVGFRRFREGEWSLPTPDDIDFVLDGDIDPMECIFRCIDTGDRWSLNDLWHDIQSACDPFACVDNGKPPVIRTTCFPYPGNVIVDTRDGPVKIGDVILRVVLAIEVEQVIIEEAKKISYRGTGDIDLQRLEFHSEKCSNGEWSIALQMPRTSSDTNQLRTRLVRPHKNQKPK